MFLSVSIPVYNAENYLDQSIQSVLRQTENDFELILVDDGSNDHSLEICREWAEQYPEKIRVIEKDNSGSLLTRRICLEESKGEYLYIMDADDYLIDENAFKSIKAIINSEDCDLLFFSCTSDVITKKKAFNFPFKDGTVFQKESLKEVRSFFLTGRGLKPLWNKVFHRSLVDWDTDYTPYVNITNGTDFFQSTPIISNAKKIYFFDKVLYFYRVTDNNTSIVHTFNNSIYSSVKANFIRASEEAKKWGFDEKELKDILCTFYMRSVSAVSFKTRLIRNNDKTGRVEYLKMIGEDELFRSYYNLSAVHSFTRKVVILLLYQKYYRLLSLLIMLVSCLLPAYLGIISWLHDNYNNTLPSKD